MNNTEGIKATGQSCCASAYNAGYTAGVVGRRPTPPRPEAGGEARMPSGIALAAIGRKHFGNPIPAEWYAAARELLAYTIPASGGK